MSLKELEEAIEKLNRHYILFLSVPRAELIDAARLGIEALEEIKRARENNYRFVAVKLPSEGEK